MEGLKARGDKLPGYAIGGVAGGESKDAFWRVVDQVISLGGAKRSLGGAKRSLGGAKRSPG